MMKRHKTIVENHLKRISQPGEQLYCSRCGKENREGANYCLYCGQPLGQFQNPGYANPGYCNPPYQSYQYGSNARFVEHKDTVVALLMALMLPGVGHMYAGEVKKGVFILAFFIIIGIAITGAFVGTFMTFDTGGDMSSAAGLILVGLIITVVIWLYQVYDAYQAALRFNAAHGLKRFY
jgi:hypothetical protein